jgi:hypothetical protein
VSIKASEKGFAKKSEEGKGVGVAVRWREEGGS